MAINKSFLDNSFREVIKSAPDNLSPLSLLGATPLNKKTTQLVTYGMGGSSTVFEGEVKRRTGLSRMPYNVVHGKQVISLTATEEAVESDYEGVIADLSAKAYSRLVADMDLAILNGTDRQSGELIEKFDKLSIAKNATQIEVTGDNLVESGDIIEALRTVKTSKAGIALTYPAWADINYAQVNGAKLHPQATPTGTFDFFGAKSLLVEGLGYNQINQEEEFGWVNGNMALIGNFSNVHRNITGYKTKVSDTATVNGVSMYETNQVAFLFEILYSFAVVQPMGPTNGFVLLKNSELEETFD